MLDKTQAIEKINNICKFNNYSLDEDVELFFRKRTKKLFTSALVEFGTKVSIFRFAFGALIKSVQREVFLYKNRPDPIKNILPELITCEIDENYAWLVYKYITGEPLGNVYQFKNDTDFGLLLDALEKICKSSVENDTIEEAFDTMTEEGWIKLLNLIAGKSSALASNGKIASIVKYLENCKKPNSKYYAHGDMHPGNIILNEGKIKIIDWESSHVSCYGFDLSFLYIRSYNDETRKRIINLVEGQKEEDAYAFYYALNVNLLRDYFEWQLIKENINELMNKRDIINNASVPDIMDDLYKQIVSNFSKLKEMEK